MQSKQISVTMPKKLYDEAVEAVEDSRYRSVQELLLAAVRERLEEHRLRRIELTARRKKSMTKEEAIAYLKKRSPSGTGRKSSG